MAIKNKEVMVLVNKKIEEMEKHFNVLETEIQKDDDKFNKSIVAVSVGKLMKLHQDVSFFLGVFDGKPKYEGQ